MELLKRIARPALTTKQEQEAYTLAIQVFQQMPPNVEVIRVAYEHFHTWMDEWIATGQRPDLTAAAEALFDTGNAGARILPFPGARDWLKSASVIAAAIAAAVAIHVLTTQNVTVFDDVISVLDIVS